MTLKVGVSYIVSDQVDELRNSLRTIGGLPDYISICIVKHKDLAPEVIEEIEDIAMDIRCWLEEDGAVTTPIYEPREGWPFPHIDDFAAARNASWKLLPEDTDYVVCIDTDDVLEPGMPEKFRDSINEMHEKAEGQPVLCDLTIVDPRLLPDKFRQNRIWSYGKFHWEGRIHEQIIPDNMEVTTIIATNTQLEITHVLRSEMIEEWKDEAILDNRPERMGDHTWISHGRNMRIIEDGAFGKYTGTPEEDKNWLQAYQFHWSEAICDIRVVEDRDIDEEWAQAVEISKSLLTSDYLGANVIFQCLLHIAEFALKTEQPEEAVKAASMMFELTFRHAKDAEISQPFYIMSRAWLQIGKHDHAILWAKAAMEIPRSYLAPWVPAPNYRMYLPWKVMEEAYQKKIKDLEAMGVRDRPGSGAEVYEKK